MLDARSKSIDIFLQIISSLITPGIKIIIAFSAETQKPSQDHRPYNSLYVYAFLLQIFLPALEFYPKHTLALNSV